MATIVQKYGGSSVADLKKLGKVADQIAQAKEAGHQVVVVVSAMGKTTEELLELAKQAASEGNTSDEAEPPRRELDMLVSTGERVSMALLSIAMHSRGLEAISFTGSQSGIITTDKHFDARIVEVRPHRIEEELKKGKVVIVAGYQGMSRKREITTLGRGGSDTTAVALAAALDAERCEIYSDVDGVYSADPNRVPDAKHLPEVDYEMLSEMAESGAKVLNAQAVEWARTHKVELRARKTGDSRKPIPETRVTTRASRARAVVVRSKLALFRARPAATTLLLDAAAKAGLALFDTAIAGANVLATAPLDNVPDFERIRTEIGKAGIEGLVVGDGVGAVTLVGTDAGTDPRVVGRALEVLPFTPMMVTTSPLRTTCVLHSEALGNAEKAWHQEFVTESESDATEES